LILVNEEKGGDFFIKPLQWTATREFRINTKGFALLKHSKCSNSLLAKGRD